ncbi:VOC family protein [Mucilaginibacter sabulilitoris]|uniref:VOC family protein n=1 Tax=Mucilaginibacter sabulilitoris TaxID=1173583 RepID=A0ABZ0TKH2_9SPHI|nr:VOC family protein [Mucilaginibacter sabulilitoris]WPU92045.1 VOC family protein [Mucilaginibacter sabulilitoris]
MDNSANTYTANRTMPPCTIIPVLVYANVAETIDWLCNTFGFNERWRVGNHRAQLSFGNDTIAINEGQMVSEARSDRQLHSLLVRVHDIAAHYDHAKRNGAEIIHAPADFPYGERQYTVKDLGGHMWTFSQSIEDLAPEDWGGVTAR